MGALDSPDVRWFASLWYGGLHTILWWAILPGGRLHIRAEWQQPRPGGSIRDFARAIRTTQGQLRIPALAYTAADKLAMSGPGRRDGETRLDTFRANGIRIREITHDEGQGWTRIAELLTVGPDGRPELSIDPSCVRLVRALTNAIQDPDDVERVQPFAGDQPLRALRIGAMSRPAPRPFTAPPLPKNAVGRLLDECRRDAGRGRAGGLAWR